MRHRATSLTTLFALAAGTMLSLPVWAATNTIWIDDPDNRGTEASPINLYDKNKWASGALPSATYNINFIAGGLTYVTNTASASTQIATSLRFGGGDFVVFGPMNSASFGMIFPRRRLSLLTSAATGHVVGVSSRLRSSRSPIHRNGSSPSARTRAATS